MVPNTSDMSKALDEIILNIIAIPKRVPLWNAKGNFYDSVLH